MESKKCTWTTLLLALVLVGQAVPLLAGNREMVESEVAQLKATNEQVLSEIPDLPANGMVEMKARVHGKRGGGEVEILEMNVIEKHRGRPPKTQEQTIDFN